MRIFSITQVSGLADYGYENPKFKSSKEEMEQSNFREMGWFWTYELELDFMWKFIQRGKVIGDKFVIIEGGSCSGRFSRERKYD